MSFTIVSNKSNFFSNILHPFSRTFIQRQSSNTPDQIEIRNYFLRKLKLKREDIYWPETFLKNGSQVDYWHHNPSSIQDMYGKNDLSKLPVFQKYINFGFWPQKYNSFSIGNDTHSRAHFSELMYERVAQQLGLDGESRVADIGCGPGFGCAYLMKHYKPLQIVGVDINEAQIMRAKNYQKTLLSQLSSEGSPDRLQFMNGASNNIPFPDGYFSHVISVEAAQHFPSLEQFVVESRRVLIPAGKLVFTTFFATNSEGKAALKALIPSAPIQCSELTHAEVQDVLSKDLENVKITSIGEYVFPGLEAWLKKIGYERQWTMLWPALYKAGLIDYSIFEGMSPSPIPNQVISQNN